MLCNVVRVAERHRYEIYDTCSDMPHRRQLQLPQSSGRSSPSVTRNEETTAAGHEMSTVESPPHTADEGRTRSFAGKTPLQFSVLYTSCSAASHFNQSLSSYCSKSKTR
jgi:hypothetical protein